MNVTQVTPQRKRKFLKNLQNPSFPFGLTPWGTLGQLPRYHAWLFRLWLLMRTGDALVEVVGVRRVARYHLVMRYHKISRERNQRDTHGRKPMHWAARCVHARRARLECYVIRIITIVMLIAPTRRRTLTAHITRILAILIRLFPWFSYSNTPILPLLSTTIALFHMMFHVEHLTYSWDHTNHQRFVSHASCNTYYASLYHDVYQLS